MDADDVKARLLSDPDYIYLPRFEYSVAKVLVRYPDGVPDRIIAQGLLITEEEVASLYESAVQKLRKLMGVG